MNVIWHLCNVSVVLHCNTTVETFRAVSLDCLFSQGVCGVMLTE